MKHNGKRKSAWSGQFYPADPASLRSMIQDFIDRVNVEEEKDEIIGIIAPHAGYEFSGQTAAAAYAYLNNKHYDTVIIVAPSHAEMIDGVSVFDGDSYITPLGSIPVDTGLAEKICNNQKNVKLSSIGHSKYSKRPEHALEVHLPFLQYVLSGPFNIVPVVFHDYHWSICNELGEAIAESIKDKSVLLVASTDLYHGYSYEDCKRIDEATIQAIERFDPQEFIIGIHQEIYQACGAGPVAAVQVAAKIHHAEKVRIVERTNSADITGMFGGWTVGYTAALIYK